MSGSGLPRNPLPRTGFYPVQSQTPKPAPACENCKRLTEGIKAAAETPFGWKAQAILKGLLKPGEAGR